MSFHDAAGPPRTPGTGAVDLVIAPGEKDIGEFSVRRVLPATRRRAIGPFVFFDHMGPARFAPGKGIAVRPHPHIGLSTVTYLFEGEIIHRDSLGVVQPIGPGAVNLMTAGRGIVHSERAGEDPRTNSRLHGIQTWMALPDGREEIAPDFVHVAASELPALELDGVSVRVIMGTVFGHTSPVPAHSPTLYAALRMAAGSRIEMPDGYTDRALYVVSGAVQVDGECHGGGRMLVLHAGRAAGIGAQEDSLLMLVGGEPVGERHLWWNFVSSSRERIEQAKADWREGRFERVPGDDEFIPLPD